jgi:hypothetical protein
MRNVENVGKWLVIGGALVWVGSLFLAPIKRYQHIGTLFLLGGIAIFVLGWVF